MCFLPTFLGVPERWGSGGCSVERKKDSGSVLGTALCWGHFPVLFFLGCVFPLVIQIKFLLENSPHL